MQLLFPNGVPVYRWDLIIDPRFRMVSQIKDLSADSTWRQRFIRMGFRIQELIVVSKWHPRFQIGSLIQYFIEDFWSDLAFKIRLQITDEI